MTLRILIFLFSLCSIVELCVRTIPPEEVFITSTGANLPGDDPCTTCDIDDIAPDLQEPGVTTFTSTETAAAGDCKKTTVLCKRTDTKKCDSVTMTAQSPSGFSSIGTSSTDSSVTSQLTCGADGTYSFNTVTGITKLSCNFVNCVEPTEPTQCTNCNIDDIAPVLAEPGVTTFTTMETAAAGECKKTTVMCQRTDNKKCDSVTISAQSASGTTSIGTSATPNSVTSQLTCAADGTYSWNAVTGITRLTCNFVNCVERVPCATCDISAISPSLPLPAGQSFEAPEVTGPDGCKQATVKCSRTDAQVCNLISIGSEGATGPAILNGVPNSNEVETTVTCQNDGTYSLGTTTGITALTCNFDTCAVPASCETCNINTFTQPTTGTGETFTATESTLADGCKQVTVKCARTDNKVCNSISIGAQGAGGSQELINFPNANEAETVLLCQPDGTYTSGLAAGITALSCNFDTCLVPPSCTSCDIGTVAPPMPFPLGTTFSSTELGAPGVCKETEVTCQRTDGQICQFVSVEVPSTDIRTTQKSDAASATLECQPDGTYAYFIAGIPNIQSLSCSFTNCYLPCTTCDINTIAPPMPYETGTTFLLSEANGPDGCKQVTVTCARTDIQVCGAVSIEATSPSGATEISNSPNSGTAEAVLTCGADGTFSFNAVTGITALTCGFTSCAAACTTCDINTIAPPNDEGTTFVSTEIGAPGACKQTQVTCRRTDGMICQATMLLISGSVRSISSPSSNQVSATLECQADGAFSHPASGLTGMQAIGCSYGSCVEACSTCDIHPIAPSMPYEAGTTFVTTELGAPGACKQTQVSCLRTDGMKCDVQILSGTLDIATSLASNGVSATLECQADKTYSYSTAMIDSIGAPLICFYDNCVLPCTTCDITTIAPAMPYPLGTSFMSTELAATGACKQTQVTCLRTDGMKCTVKLLADALDIATSPASSEASVTLECQADGTYSYPTAMLTGITSLTCDYSNCVLPCETCDINAVAPPPSTPGVTYVVTEGTGPGGCKTAVVKCSRTDGLICDTVIIGSDGASGPTTLNIAFKSGEGEATLACQGDGTYASGSATGINAITCQFGGPCLNPCTTCDVYSLNAPPYVVGQSISAIESIGPGGCKQVQVTCGRTDGQLCGQTVIGVLTAGGPQVLNTATNAAQVSATLTCQGDGTYALGPVTGITDFTCSFATCAPPCGSTCDINSIPNIGVGANVILTKTQTTLANGCLQAVVRCERTDNVICTSSSVRTNTASGLQTLATTPTSNQVQAMLTCQTNGMYALGAITGMTGFLCSFSGCVMNG